MGVLLAEKFYKYKVTGERDYFFGRDVPGTGRQSDLLHVHVAPSQNTQAWIDQFNKPYPNDYYRTSDQFLLYAKYSLLNRPTEYLLIDFFHDPGGHQRLREYIGDVHSDFSNLRTLPKDATCLISPEDTQKKRA